jgi:hypothetical protein
MSVFVILVGVVPMWHARRPTRARAGLSIAVFGAGGVFVIFIGAVLVVVWHVRCLIH